METPPKQSSNIFAGASPKLTFIFGAVCGVAATALIAMTIFVTAGFSTTKSTKASTATTTNTANTNTVTFTNVSKVSSADYLQGNKSAKITLIEFSDLECPYCKNFHTTMTNVLTHYGDKVNFVYRQFPLSFHANAQKEAEAALCIGDLGGTAKYYDFIDKVFTRTTSNGTGFALDALGPLAKEVGVDQTKFQNCLDTGKMTAKVTAEENDGSQGGASGTPTTFVVDQNGKTITAIPGAYTEAQVESIVDQALTSV